MIRLIFRHLLCAGCLTICALFKLHHSPPGWRLAQNKIMPSRLDSQYLESWDSGPILTNAGLMPFVLYDAFCPRGKQVWGPLYARDTEPNMSTAEQAKSSRVCVITDITMCSFKLDFGNYQPIYQPFSDLTYSYPITLKWRQTDLSNVQIWSHCSLLNPFL